MLDASTSLAGAYCAKLLTGAGATVTLLEPADGAPMRRWSWDRELPAGRDGALFQFLRHGQRSVTKASPALLAGSDVAHHVRTHPVRERRRYRRCAPGSGRRLAHPVRPHRALRRPPRHRVHRPGRRRRGRDSRHRRPAPVPDGRPRSSSGSAGPTRRSGRWRRSRRLVSTGVGDLHRPLALRGREPHRQQLRRPRRRISPAARR